MAEAYGAWAETYEELVGEAAAAVWRAGVGAEVARLARGPAEVLDLGAGTGIGERVLAELRSGLSVTSLELSEAMLERGNVPPDRRIVGDMAAFSVAPRTFDFVVSGFDSMNYLSPAQLTACLSCVSDALPPGGHLVFDYCSARFLGGLALAAPSELVVGDRRLHRRHSFEPEFPRCRTVLSLYRERQLLWRETHLHYVTDPFAMDDLARRTGLETVLVRNLRDQRFSPEAVSHVYVMRKT